MAGESWEQLSIFENTTLREPTPKSQHDLHDFSWQKTKKSRIEDPSEDGALAGKLTPPESVAEHEGILRTGKNVVLDNGAAQRRQNPEDAEIAGAYQLENMDTR
jgi:hypothetical protein